MANENVKKLNMSISVDDGTERVPIMNKHGDEIGVFYFRPTDVGIIDRYNQVTEKFDEITKPLEEADAKAVEGETDEEKEARDLEALHEAEKRLYEAVDFMFDGNFAEAFFGKMRPFSPINGRFYCETALEAVGNYISAAFEKETTTITKRAEKYTKGLK